MTVIATYPWTLAGLTLGDYRYGVETLDAIDGLTPSRHQPRIRPAMPGETGTPDAPRATKTTALRIYISGTNASGAVTHAHGPQGHYHVNRDTLLDALDTTDLITVTREVPTTTVAVNDTWTSDVYATRAEIRRAGPANGHLDVLLVHPYPYWLEDTVNSHTVTTAGFAAMSPAPTGSMWVYNASYSFAAASTLIHEDSAGTEDASLIVTGTPAGGYPVVVNPYAGTVVDNAGGDAQGLLTWTHDFWARFRSGNSRFKRSAGNVTISWQDHHP